MIKIKPTRKLGSLNSAELREFCQRDDVTCSTCPCKCKIPGTTTTLCFRTLQNAAEHNKLDKAGYRKLYEEVKNREVEDYVEDKSNT